MVWYRCRIHREDDIFITDTTIFTYNMFNINKNGLLKKTLRKTYELF